MFVITLIFVTVVLPIWLLLHYLTKWRTSRFLSKDDTRLLEESWQNLKSLESRINNLETILKNSNPDWRKNT